MINDVPEEEEVPLFIAPGNYAVRIGENGRDVWLRIGRLPPEVHPDPRIVFAMSMAPEEALHLGHALVETAREALKDENPH
ncbi:hypothetical protein [uncultured Roseibium sp.]|uniref:hypothetical protein n=1 Tax=uncultured Roseibium sp. TaxID=1936171 RepID=UPI002615B6FA|nr:hypothetical protein [uncultured Roseibium sp.]